MHSEVDQILSGGAGRFCLLLTQCCTCPWCTFSPLYLFWASRVCVGKEGEFYRMSSLTWEVPETKRLPRMCKTFHIGVLSLWSILFFFQNRQVCDLILEYLDGDDAKVNSAHVIPDILHSQKKMWQVCHFSVFPLANPCCVQLFLAVEAPQLECLGQGRKAF